MKHKGRKFQISSVTTKIIAVNILTLLICTMGVGLFNIYTFQNESVMSSGYQAVALAKTIAVVVDGDNIEQSIATGEKNAIWLHEKEIVDSIFNQQENFAFLYVLSAEYDENVINYMAADRYMGSDLGDLEPIGEYATEMFQTIKTGDGSMSGIYEIGQYGTAVSGFMPIHNSSDSIVGVVGVDILIEDVFSPSRVFTFISDLLITLILCSIVPISLQIFLFRRMIGRPIKELSSACTKIGSGELDVPLSIDTGDEIEDLAHTLTKMTTQLKEYIANLTKITAEKERIEVELNIATQIQASMLPCVFPAFPDRDEFDIYAMMQPAKEVGGDFYDFFQVDENTLAVVMADVSGKGIPGALFMVISKTLIKNNALDGKSPKEVFETVNNMLCENNGAGMFVTAFLGYIDIPSGKFTFVNAGHNPPLLRNGERFDWMKTKRGFVLAGKENMHYKEVEMVLQPGDELFLYTDGVTEATNNENELFSETRLCETVNEYHDLPLKEIAMSLMHEIDTFVEGAEQADDITMLVLRYHGSEEEV